MYECKRQLGSVVLKCTSVEADNNIFTSGHLYSAYEGINGSGYWVVDDQRLERFILKDSMDFIVRNSFNPCYAFFEVAYATSEYAEEETDNA